MLVSVVSPAAFEEEVAIPLAVEDLYVSPRCDGETEEEEVDDSDFDEDDFDDDFDDDFEEEEDFEDDLPDEMDEDELKHV